MFPHGGAWIHTPWPWPRGEQKKRERARATKPLYYIRGFYFTAISGLGRFGGGGVLASDFDHQNHVVHLGLGRASALRVVATIVDDNSSAEKRDILDLFERDDLSSSAGADRELVAARRAARNASNSTETV